ncbi:unnamed protein product, partial [Prorocentrum cordatum]
MTALCLNSLNMSSSLPQFRVESRGRRARISGAWLDSQRGAAPGAPRRGAARGRAAAVFEQWPSVLACLQVHKGPAAWSGEPPRRGLAGEVELACRGAGAGSPAGAAAHGRVERPVALSLDAACLGAGGAPDWGPRLWDCMLLATTRGRVVRLRQRPSGDGAEAELVPAEVVHEAAGADAAPWTRGQARSLGRQRTGLLQADDRSVAVLEPGSGAPAGWLTMPSSAGRLAAFCSTGGDVSSPLGGARAAALAGVAAAAARQPARQRPPA